MMLRTIYKKFTKWGLSCMKNRDKYILRKNEYDMLMQIQYNILDRVSIVCVIDGLTGGLKSCPEEWSSASNKLDVCSKCIQAWLNEES